MYLSRALLRSLAPPDWLSINVTLRCNLRCAMCTTCYEVPRELETGEILGIIDQAALWGVRVFNPLGGEPFVRPDLETILAHAACKDFHVTLTTNGTLIDRRRANLLAAIPPEKLHMSFSLDGPEPVHDAIRGPGTFQRALEGYRQLRQADRQARNPHRKILANTLIHAHNLALLPTFLDELATLDFDGVQLLNLFRRSDAQQRAELDPERARQADALWIPPERIPELERLVEALIAQVRNPPHSSFRIQNPLRDLQLLPSYYQDRLQPLEAPCWAGWKELYINADGGAIMCDGQLDFLAGRFGDARRSTLWQLWRSPELRRRRAVVKRCRTPCIQNCYLRRDSDQLAPLLRRGLGLAQDKLRPRLPSAAGRARHLPAGRLTLELADICDCAWAGCATPRERLDSLLADAPEPLEACYREPERWYRWRDRHYVDFGRGFMGFELVRRISEDLRQHGFRFGTLALRWRGEPLLHPEFLPVLRYLLERTGPDLLYGRLRIETHGLLLAEDQVAAALERPAPQEWCIDLDRAGEHEQLVRRHLEPLLRLRGPNLRLVAALTVPEQGMEEQELKRRLAPWRALLRHPLLVAGTLPAGSSDAIWLRRADPRSFLGDQAATSSLCQAAEALGASQDLPQARAARRCPGPFSTPVISWDGKITLCPWDQALDNRLGEVTHQSLGEIWSSARLGALRDEVRAKGVPGLGPCRDCHQMFSPNYRQATEEELGG